MQHATCNYSHDLRMCRTLLSWTAIPLPHDSTNLQHGHMRPCMQFAPSLASGSRTTSSPLHNTMHTLLHVLRTRTLLNMPQSTMHW